MNCPECQDTGWIGVSPGVVHECTCRTQAIPSKPLTEVETDGTIIDVLRHTEPPGWPVQEMMEQHWKEEAEAKTETPVCDATFAMLVEEVGAFAKGVIYKEDLKVSLMQQREHIRQLEIRARQAEAANAKLLAENAALREDRAEIADYLWPDQTGLPNTFRNCLIAIKARERLLKAQVEEFDDLMEFKRQVDSEGTIPASVAQLLEDTERDLTACQSKLEQMRGALEGAKGDIQDAAACINHIYGVSQSWRDEHHGGSIPIANIDAALSSTAAPDLRSIADGLAKALEDVLTHAQGIRIREVQAMTECGTWSTYKQQSDHDWSELNRVHHAALTAYRAQP